MFWRPTSASYCYIVTQPINYRTGDSENHEKKDSLSNRMPTADDAPNVFHYPPPTIC
jgi:hypothetical protein